MSLPQVHLRQAAPAPASSPRRGPRAVYSGPVRYLRTVELPVDELVDWPGNPRLHDDDLIDASIELYGQTRSVMCRELPDGRVQLLGGHGTRDGFKRAGYATVRCEVLEVTDDDIARGIVSMDNRSNDRAGYDDELLLAELQRAEQSPLGLDGTGWNGDEMDDLRAQLEEAGRQVMAQPQPALPGAGGENVPPSGIQGANSIEDKLAAYAAGSAQGGAVRSVILSYAGAQYVWMVEQLAALQHVHDVDSNAEVVRKLVEEAIGQAAPAAEGWTDAVPDAGEAASPDA
jgi:hypothetical protein